MHSIHHEPHFSNRNNWLRATVLGANDGLISTASLLMGVAAAQVDGHVLMLTGVASLIAGAISMAAGEYVSVSSQSDTEKADLAKDKWIELTYDFSGVASRTDYDRIVIQFGAEGHAGPGFFFFDDFSFDK